MSQFNRETEEITCPNCEYVSNFGNFTVLNSVDKVLQVPSLLGRLGKNRHDYIQSCPRCHINFEEESGVVLTNNENKELNEIYEREGSINHMIGTIEGGFIVIDKGKKIDIDDFIFITLRNGKEDYGLITDITEDKIGLMGGRYIDRKDIEKIKLPE